MPQKVSILGGGVAGLSAAHELAERGFEVHVFERKLVMGGKARSIPVPGSAVLNQKPLPGEHGFRFFPGYYKHVTDTMRRIRYDGGGNVFDNLTVATRPARKSPASRDHVACTFPGNVGGFASIPGGAVYPSWCCTCVELSYFVTRLLIVATSCSERRLAEFKNIAWWDFIAASPYVENLPGLPGTGSYLLPGRDASRRKQHT